MKKNYICPSIECKALMPEFFMQQLTQAKIQMSAPDLKADQIFMSGCEIGVDNNQSGYVSQDAKFSDWDDL